MYEKEIGIRTVVMSHDGKVTYRTYVFSKYGNFLSTRNTTHLGGNTFIKFSRKTIVYVHGHVLFLNFLQLEHKSMFGCAV